MNHYEGVIVRGASAAYLLLLCALIGCSEATDTASVPDGPDTTTPFPIDQGGTTATAPGTYKGLPLRLHASGEPAVSAVDGRIGVVCIGMSNAAQECDEFMQRFAAEYSSAVNPAVRFANCAVGGNAIERWNDPANDAQLWRRCVNTVLPQAGLRVDQVRVIWHKAANQFTTANGRALPFYPASGSDYIAFFNNLETFAKRVKGFFPAVQAVYTTSRSYGGFGGVGRNEPLSYEEGHALNTWLSENASVDGVWYGWGPYIWAPDCATGITNKAGVCYVRADYVSDGVHPSPTGRAKISAQLHAFLLTQRWYRR